MHLTTYLEFMTFDDDSRFTVHVKTIYASTYHASEPKLGLLLNSLHSYIDIILFIAREQIIVFEIYDTETKYKVTRFIQSIKACNYLRYMERRADADNGVTGTKKQSECFDTRWVSQKQQFSPSPSAGRSKQQEIQHSNKHVPNSRTTGDQGAWSFASSLSHA